MPENMTGAQFYDYLFSQPDVIDMRADKEVEKCSLASYQDFLKERLEKSLSHPPEKNLPAIPKTLDNTTVEPSNDSSSHLSDHTVKKP